MARYGTQIQQTPVDMYNPLNVKFYSDILDKAQGNLNQGAALQTKFLEDAYGTKYANKEARDKAIGEAEQQVAGLLDANFISPASVVKGIGKASQNLAPWRNLNEKQLELIKQAEAYKLQHGANALITDPSKAQLMDANGNWINPDQLKLTAVNAEDYDKVFLTSEKGELTSKFDRKVKSDLPYKYKFETVEGLSPQQIEERYGVNGKDAIRLAEQQIAAAPQILEVFNGDKNKAIEYLRNRNLSTAGQFGQSITSKYEDNEWGLHLAKESLKKKEENNLDTPFYPSPGGVFTTNKTPGQQLMSLTGGKEEVDWGKATFNPQGNLMTQGWVTDTRLGGKEGDKYSAKILVNNPQYKEAFNQLFTYKQMLVKQGVINKYTDISDKEAIGMMKKASENSAKYYGLHNESISDTWSGDNFNAVVDSDGRLTPTIGKELEIYNESTGTWEITSPEKLTGKLGFEKGTADKNVVTQLKEGSGKIIDYSSGIPRSIRTVLGADGTSYTVRSRFGNEAAEKFATPFAQAQTLLVSAGESVISMDELGVSMKVVVQPVEVTDPRTNQPEIINRVVSVSPVGENPSPASIELSNAIMASPSPEKALIKYTKNYRDQLYNNYGIVKKKKKDIE